MQLRRLNEVPATLNRGALDRAIENFVADSHSVVDNVSADGLCGELAKCVAASIVFKNSPDSFVWVAEDAGEAAAWAMTQVRKDIDGSKCYWMTNAWVAKQHRFKPYVKEWFQTLRADAKAQGCSHILIPSSRSSRAYCRFLGGGFKEYLTILKEDVH